MNVEELRGVVKRIRTYVDEFRIEPYGSLYSEEAVLTCIFASAKMATTIAEEVGGGLYVSRHSSEVSIRFVATRSALRVVGQLREPGSRQAGVLSWRQSIIEMLGLSGEEVGE